MTPEQKTIVEAFDRHRWEHHKRDYEVCIDPQCEAAYRLECVLRAAFERGAEAMKDFIVSAGMESSREIRDLPLPDYTP